MKIPPVLWFHEILLTFFRLLWRLFPFALATAISCTIRQATTNETFFAPSTKNSRTCARAANKIQIPNQIQSQSQISSSPTHSPSTAEVNRKRAAQLHHHHHSTRTIPSAHACKVYKPASQKTMCKSANLRGEEVSS